MTPKPQEPQFAMPCNEFATDSTVEPISFGALNNRAFELSPDGWYHIGPIGEFPHVANVRRKTGELEQVSIIQVLDQTAYKAIVNRFKSDRQDLLIDYEHFSQDEEKSSVAAGWIQDLELRGDGLYAKPKLSNRGKEDIEGGNYRKISPVFDEWKIVERGDPIKLRPGRMPEAGLTNKPNLKSLNPLSNRATNHNPTKDTMDHKPKLIVLLGLEASASDDQIEAAYNKHSPRINELESSLSKSEKTIETLGTALLNRDLSKYERVLTDENKEQFKDLLLNNRESAIVALDSLAAVIPAKEKTEEAKPGEEFTPTYNKETATAPNAEKILDKAAQAAEEEELLSEKISNRARSLQRSDKDMSIAATYSQARQEIASEEKAASK